MTLRALILQLVLRLRGSIPVWMLTKEECPPHARALALLAAANAQGIAPPLRADAGPEAATPKVTIRVAEAFNQTTNSPCYAVTLTTDETPPRTATFPVDDLEEAKALAQSIKRFVELGCDIEEPLG